jgi:lactate dehydrogenase-like 2-hydroxyacid dehydrogenase
VKKHLIIVITAAAVLITGCAAPSQIGTIDISRIVSNWSVFQNYQNQLLVDEQTIEQSKDSPQKKAQEARALQLKYGKITEELTKQIKDAAAKVAQKQNLKLVVTKQGVGYGGVDITAAVEKVMNITETASPSPSSS